MSTAEEVTISGQLAVEVRKFLTKAESSLFPSTGYAVVDGVSPDRSAASYASLSDADKLLFIARGTTRHKDGALSLITTVVFDPRNHLPMCRRGVLRDIAEALGRAAPSVVPQCVAAAASLANTPDAREYFRDAGCIAPLVATMCNPAFLPLRETGLRALATLSTGSPAMAAELVRAGAIPVLAGTIKMSMEACALSASGQSADDPVFTNSLWAVAAISCSPESHLPMLREGLVDTLTRVLEKCTTSTTYSDYALSCLLQLTAKEECRQLMVTYKCHEVLLQRQSCGVPSIVRRALQVLANLCVDEPSRATLASLPRVFELLLATARKFDSLLSGGDQRSLLQCLKLLSNLIQTQKESDLFRKSEGVQWLADLASQCAKGTPDPAIEQQLAHLVANVLIHEENHDLWVSTGSVQTLKALVSPNKTVGVRKEAARAISNLIAYHDEIRDSINITGCFAAVLDSLRQANDDPAPSLGLLLFLLRAAASVALSHHRTSELYGAGLIDVVAGVRDKVDNAIGTAEEAFGVKILLLSVLTNMSGSFDTCRQADTRSTLVTHPKIGIEWATSLLQCTDRAVQLAALRHVIQLATTCKGRQWIHEKNVDVEGAMGLSAEGENQRVIKHLWRFVHILKDVLAFTHNPGAKAQPQQPAPAAQQPSEDSSSADAAATTDNGSASLRSARRERRARHKALVFTADQLQGLGSNGSSGTDSSQPVIEPAGIRFVLLNEFCSTERRYVTALNLATWKFARPLQGLPPNPPKGIVGSTAVRLVFGPLEAVTAIATTFIDLLETRIREGGASCLVGDIFVQFASKLQVYTEYSELYPQAISALTDSLRKYPSFARFVERTEKSPHCSGRTLRSFLALPLERVQAYATFLSDFSSATSESHSDYNALGEALEKIKAGMHLLQKNDASDLEKIINVEQRLKGQCEILVGPGRKYITEARLRLLQIGDQPLEATFDVVLFLFSDLLVIAKVAKQDKCKMLDRLLLAEIIVGSVEEALPPALAKENCFKIQRCTVGSTLKSGYILAAPTQREQKTLVDTILQAQTVAIPK